jgi:hypothetical protein
MSDKEQIVERLRTLEACSEAIEWAETQPSLEAAWQNCDRGDWMLWYAAKVGSDHKKLVLAACGCARTALEFVPQGEQRPLAAIETAERWASGDESVSLDDMKNAASAAYAASATNAAAASAAFAAFAAYAASAAFATYAAVAYAAFAAYAASAASASSAAASAAAYAKLAVLKHCADIVRIYLPVPPTKQEER